MNHPDATPDRLVRAARKLFSDKGFDRASVRAITRAANANIGAVTYHFGSKDRLRDEVLMRLVGDLAARLEAIAALPLPAPQRLGRVVHAVFAYAAESPDAPRLLVRFLLHTGRMPAPVLARQRALLGAVVRVIRDGVAAGEFRPVDPFLAAFSVLSQCIWFHLIRGIAAQLSDAPLERPEGAAAMATHITDVILRAFAPATT
jgi:AcrR family transcriptional regulator